MNKTGIISIALDLGTTSIKAARLNQNGELNHLISRPAPFITIIDDHY
jgi:glycerol kinase